MGKERQRGNIPVISMEIALERQVKINLYKNL